MISAGDGPTAPSQALPVSIAYVLSFVSRALQEQNPEYPHPFPAHKGPTINFVLETPTWAPVILSQPYSPPPPPRHKEQEEPEEPRGSVLVGRSTKAHPIFFILWQESGLLKKRTTDPPEERERVRN